MDTDLTKQIEEMVYVSMYGTNWKDLDMNVDKVANQIIGELSQESKEYMIKNPRPVEYHFSLGLYIRNNYIYNSKEFGNCYRVDDISSEIIKRIIDKLTEENTD